jgi:hypothetical protein
MRSRSRCDGDYCCAGSSSLQLLLGAFARQHQLRQAHASARRRMCPGLGRACPAVGPCGAAASAAAVVGGGQRPRGTSQAPAATAVAARLLSEPARGFSVLLVATDRGRAPRSWYEEGSASSSRNFLMCTSVAAGLGMEARAATSCRLPRPAVAAAPTGVTLVHPHAPVRSRQPRYREGP